MTASAVDALHAERQLVLDLVATLTPQEWDLPSDCAGWRVRDVIAHMGATFVNISGGTTARAVPPTDEFERNSDAAVDERRPWSTEQIVAEYTSASVAAIQAMAAMQEPELRDQPLPLEDLGTYPMHVLADAIVFDHYCHLRHDLLAPGGPLERPPLPSDELRLRPTMTWLLAGLPQMCAVAFAPLVDRPLTLVIDGPASGTWTIRPGSPLVTVEEGAAADAVAVVRSNAHDFVSWSTKRRDWRDKGVTVEGDAMYAVRVLDAINLI